MLHTSPVLPESLQTLPKRTKACLELLVHFARWYRVYKQLPEQTAQVGFFMPQWVLALVLGVHPDSIRRWFKNPALRLVAAYTPYAETHKGETRYTTCCWSVVLNPSEETRATIVFESGEYSRDMPQEAQAGRIRERYTPQGKSLLEYLINWVTQSVCPLNTTTLYHASETLTPVDNLAADIELLAQEPVPELREAVAKTLIKLLNGSASYLGAWINVLKHKLSQSDLERYFFKERLRYYALNKDNLNFPCARFYQELKQSF